MKTKNYLSNKSKLSTCLASTRIYVTLAAMLLGSTLMAQVPELIDGSPLNAKGFTELGNRIYFNGESSNGDKWLLSTTGNEVDRHPGVAPVNYSANDPSEMVALNGQLILQGRLVTTGQVNLTEYELYGFNHSATHQTFDFPTKIKDINPGVSSSSPRGMTELNGNIYFAADDGTNGRELWVTDGTEAGTQLLKDINPGSDNSSPRRFFEYNGSLLFIADNGTDGRELWVTDGTSQGTEMVKDINPGFAPSQAYGFAEFDDKVYFRATGDNGTEPWVTDGTESGTYMLKDIYPGNMNSGSFPFGFTAFNGNLYFYADDNINGRELWISDGTTSGTSMLKDINPGNGGSYPNQFTELDGLLYFGASDGTNSGLWKTDGTTGGTTLVYSDSGSPRGIMINYDGRLYYVASDANGDGKLWVSDGTTGGTELASDPSIAPNTNPFYLGEDPSQKSNFIVAHGNMYYTADYDNNGLKLYKLTTNNLGIKDYETIDFVVHPNPVEDILHLESGAHQISEIILFSIKGQRLQTWDGKSEINLSEYNSGNYLVKITTENNKSVTKQIIKK
ncbi:hypothetical protein CAP47_07290 [Psychroflexus sp. S27]|uniref:ELWxxDGT repeat protein n=1 Tax=Psychroflexus sp. S27 TaxID=1982757 RepID=UPI000C2A2BE7|nr:ELWxxDGT repeat protein [Psychroflexus sp. S27]PJX22821.1 hypothetical protein CAP47_07290 [Psychroflexus sp. S27]